MRDQLLRVTEVFYSLQGETRLVGLPTVFIRLTGCPLRCYYCDTAYAFTGGEKISIEKILQQVSQYKTKYITVTGGEPLAQKGCLDLLTILCDENYKVSLETSGAIDIKDVDSRVLTVLDIKTPASGEEARNIYDNFKFIKKSDQIKFVICDGEDYEWAKMVTEKYALTDKCEILFSPVNPTMDATELADKILQDQLAVRFQIQLHKKLWGDVAGK